MKNIGTLFESSLVLSAIYPLSDGIIPLYENQSMPINPNEGLIKTKQLEVYLHPTEDGCSAISPNNAAFLVSTIHPIIPFFL